MPGFLGGSSGASSSGAGGEITFPKEFIDPVTKLRVSQPENLIDTDFEYGLQPTKWETVELINNTPSFFSKSGDTTIPGIVSIVTNAGTREITVTTALDHGLAVGIPINVQGTKSVTADGSYIINSIPDSTTFTYLSRDIQDNTSAIEDLYTSIITGEFFQGSQLRVAESDGIVTDAASISTLTVTTENPHGFGPNTPFYFLNLNSTISQEFEAANTAAKSFDASNSATAQTFDGSNSLSSLNIDWSNSATVGGTISTVNGVNTTDNTVTVAHSTENFFGLPVGQPLYYSVNASLGYFLENPRGVVFLKTVDNLGEGISTFQVSEVPDGDAINLQSNMTGSFQIANQARAFAGNNVNSETETVINVVRDSAIEFEGANDQALGGNGFATVTGFNSPFINLSTTASAGLDYYIGAMVRYDTTGSAASGLQQGETYFISSFQDLGSDNYTIALKEFPTDANLISVSGGTGTQTFTRIGVSITKDIVHIKNSQFSEKDMLEYEFPVNGNFTADEEKSFYFVNTAYDAHNYSLNPVTESVISATGGDVVQTIQDSTGRDYTAHRFINAGTYTFTVTDAGTFDQTIKYVVTDGSYDGATVNGEVSAATGTYTVVVNAGGRVDIAYPQDQLANNIAFSTIYAQNMEATGGSVSDVNIDGREYRVHTFTSVGTSTFEVTKVGGFDGGAVDVLIVAGGGSGAGGLGAGGGAGGMIDSTTDSSITKPVMEAQSYTVIVGNGGAGRLGGSGQPGPAGNNGQDSSFAGLVAIGGGYAGHHREVRSGGNAGGSGGGAGPGDDGPNILTGGAALQPSSASGGYGNRGGNSPPQGSNYPSGGGGGAGERGQETTNQRGSGQRGGNGLQSNIDGNNFYYAGGGGGSEYDEAQGAGNGGLGGGGGGSTRNGTPGTGGAGRNPGGNGARGNGTRGGNGGANTGGGGGGSTWDDSRGGDGGSGIVIIRYPLEPETGGGV